MKIITLTVNPALDKSATIEGLVPEQKLKCNNIEYQPGGGGINISRLLSRLSVETTCMFTSGGDTGKLISQLLLKESINSKTITVANPTRENFAVVDAKTGFQYRFGMPGAAISKQELLAIEKLLIAEVNEGDILVLSGSLADGMPSDYYSQLIKLFSEKKVKIIVDTSGPALSKVVNETVYLIKPNQKELALLAGKEFLTKKEQELFALELVNTNKATYVAVSLGARGAFIASKEGIFYQSTPSVKVTSTIGAGDSMVAGLIYAIQQKLSSKEMIKWGVACGVATTMSNGTSLASLSNIKSVLELLE